MAAVAAGALLYGTARMQHEYDVYKGIERNPQHIIIYEAPIQNIPNGNPKNNNPPNNFVTRIERFFWPSSAQLSTNQVISIIDSLQTRNRDPAEQSIMNSAISQAQIAGNALDIPWEFPMAQILHETRNLNSSEMLGLNNLYGIQYPDGQLVRFAKLSDATDRYIGILKRHGIENTDNFNDFIEKLKQPTPSIGGYFTDMYYKRNLINNLKSIEQSDNIGVKTAYLAGNPSMLRRGLTEGQNVPILYSFAINGSQNGVTYHNWQNSKKIAPNEEANSQKQGWSYFGNNNQSRATASQNPNMPAFNNGICNPKPGWNCFGNNNQNQAEYNIANRQTREQPHIKLQYTPYTVIYPNQQKRLF